MGILRKIAEFLGLGRLPENLKKDLAAEHLLFLAEGIPATLIFRSYKTLGVCLSYRNVMLFGFVVISEKRFVAKGGTYDQLDVSIGYDDPKFNDITFSRTKKHLVLDYNAGVFQPDASGRITVRLRLEDPEFVLNLLKAKGAKIEVKG